MRKVFALTMVLGFIFGSYAFAWQDPCSATENSYEWEGYVLGDWTPAEAMFSPAPECEGTVILRAPDGTWYSYGYIGNRGILTVAEVLFCRVADNGDLICKVITKPAVPEESTILILEQE